MIEDNLRYNKIAGCPVNHGFVAYGNKLDDIREFIDQVVAVSISLVLFTRSS